MDTGRQALDFLEEEIDKREKKTVLTFNEYLKELQQDPGRILRNIFQLFYDLIKGHVVKKVDQYPDDPESIGFMKYDCTKLFVAGADNPFFADQLFANRFIRQIESLHQGFQQNRVYAYEGPSGCGKSTFLNNLLRAFEAYTATKEGRSYEILWEIDEGIVTKAGNVRDVLIIPCPSHDYPIMIIPKKYRVEFLKQLLPKEVVEKIGLFREKEYEWLLRGEACTICKSIFWALLEKMESLQKVLSMVKVRPYKFDRRVGEGISIFNPGDRPTWSMGEEKPDIGWLFTDTQIQERLNKIFGVNAVRYVYSFLAKTNNGTYVLMDVKGHNENRLLELHNVISEGVHKVGDIEEDVNSLFFALMNPEDKEFIVESKMESFQGRIQYNTIPYVLEPGTEVSIYRNIFGDSIRKRFLPQVMENFARVVIASRMNQDCEPLHEWVPSLEKYKRFCDEHGLLLRMEIYSGVIPDWLSEEDRKSFTAPLRRLVIAEGENEGDRGFSGRDSIVLFGSFFERYSGRPSLINMDNVVDFFKHKIERSLRDQNIPKLFLASLTDSYDYRVLNEIKGALYFYNTEQITKDILNYLWAVNYDLEAKVKCNYTGEEIWVTIDFLKLMASRFTGKTVTDAEALRFAQDIQRKYGITKSRERITINETELFKDLFAAYVKNLKERVLQPFIGNPNFRETVKSFGNSEFDTFDTRLKDHVTSMIKNLMEKFGYTEQGAKEICLYVIDKNLAQKFA
ncbi:MAG: serine protein kinase PrkA [bacterium]|nr:serine protein kinase PrkA [bacterium]